jgi:histidinol-phosphate aminotransferase
MKAPLSTLSVEALVKPGLAGLKAYRPEEGQAGILLDANENPWAPPEPWLREAGQALARLDLNRYPDPLASELRRRVSRAYGVPADRIVFGNGSDECIQLLAGAFASPGSTCLVPDPTFSMFRACALSQGLEPLEEPLGPDFGLTGAFLERAKSAVPRLIFLASPNNPTGNSFSEKAIESLLSLPRTVVVLDEAYAEFSRSSWLGRLGDFENLVVLRTLSKAYGMAGLRLGMLFAKPALTRELEKVRLPYNVNAVTQCLAALALEDRHRPSFQAQLEEVLAAKAVLGKRLAGARGLEVLPSQANFFLVRCPQASALHRALMRDGIRVRSFNHPRLRDCLRITVGKPAENEALCGSIEKFFQGDL